MTNCSSIAILGARNASRLRALALRISKLLTFRGSGGIGGQQ